MLLKKSILILAILSSVALQAASRFPLKGGENILFIGNSLTASLSNTLPEMLDSNRQPTFNGHRIQIWNQTLETHWKFTPTAYPGLLYDTISDNGYIVKGFASIWRKGQYNTAAYINQGYIAAADAIVKGTPEGKPWDIVVLQDYSVGDKQDSLRMGRDSLLTSDGRFFTYATKFINLVRSVNATPVLYMNWELNPDTPNLHGGSGPLNTYYNTRTDLSIANYKALSRALNVPVVPCGEAFKALSASAKPPIDTLKDGWLYRDVVHPNTYGSAVVHYSFVACLSGKPATGLKFSYASTPPAKVDSTIRYVVNDFVSKYGWLSGATPVRETRTFSGPRVVSGRTVFAPMVVLSPRDRVSRSPAFDIKGALSGGDARGVVFRTIVR